MKKVILSIALVAGLITAKAQTNGLIIPQFYNTAVSWVTDLNTNIHTFDDDICHLELQVGADYVQGVNATASIGLEYHVYKNFVIDSITKNAGVAGTVVSQQIGGGISFRLANIELTGLIDGGYDLQRNRAFFEPRVEIKKGMTDRTYVGMGIGVKIDDFKSKSISPTLSAYVGITL
jgi:hypothetical protein